ICCDPRLVTGKSLLAGDSEPDSSAQKTDSPNPSASPFADSAKLDSFREILAEALDDGHRLLVFSQFTSLLALLRADLDEQGIAYCYLDGSMSTAARQAQVDRFQAPVAGSQRSALHPQLGAAAAPPVFLLSLKAGGTGLNLTAADTVVHLDPWWNPAAEAQATDRAHRIGQTRVVTSYKLVASGTVEEKVLALQDEKRALLANVFEASDAAAAKLSLADLKSLLK
ncbi:MAG: C-terminal helicase domain-containing protein, partial [Verrucomicrobia bacterium]|nr:C-terminal helicase domain-containing protein [Verrucomicrobiota bacterium]